MMTLKTPLHTQPQVAGFVFVVVIIQIGGGVAAIGRLRPLCLEGSEVFITVDFRDPANGSKIKTDKDRFVIDDLELSEVIEDIADSLMVFVDGYRKVVTYGC